MEAIVGHMIRRVRILVASVALVSLASGFLIGCTQLKPAEFRALQSRAQQGDVEAQYRLGVIYLDGQGVPADEFEAEKWLTRAARGGNSSAYIRLLPIVKRRESRDG